MNVTPRHLIWLAVGVVGYAALWWLTEKALDRYAGPSLWGTTP